MKILAVGVSHKTAPIEVRERLALTTAELPSTLACLSEGLGAAVILSTCNRTELYATVADEHITPESLISPLLAYKSLDSAMDRSIFYVLSHKDAVRHLYRVASGIDSMVLGEAEILGQVKGALRAAQNAGAVDPLLSRLFRSAITVGRQARNQTGIGRYAVSVSGTAVALAKEVFGDLRGRTVLVIGAGQSGKLAAKSLAASGASNLLVISRTHSRSQELASMLNGRAIPLTDLAKALTVADIVISSTGAGNFLLGLDDVSKATSSRNGQPLLLIDIAVPRDIDPRVQGIPGVHLYDIDDLEEVSHASLQERAREVHRVEAIVDAEVERFIAWWHSLEVVPTITALRQQAEAIRCAEVERTLRRLPHLSERDQHQIEAMASSIVNKLLHRPIARLKEDGDGRQLTEAVSQLFGLDEA